MVQKEKEIKANTKFLRQEVHLHRETDVSAFFVLVGVQYTCDVPEVRTDSVSVVSKNVENVKKYIKQENTYHILFKITIKNRGLTGNIKIYKKNV